MQKREDLSEKEKKFLKKKSRWRKILTFFFPVIASVCLKKNDSYMWTCGILLIIASFLSGMWQKTSWAEAWLFLAMILVLIAKTVAISDFTEMTYKSNPYLFKEFLDEYHNYHDVIFNDEWYDEFWFNQSWIHKDTWTKYDKNWFNRDARIALKNAWWEQK